MISFIKKYWDIFGGAFTGLGLAVLAKFKLEKVQLYYSIIILVLVSIGIFRIIKQEREKHRKKAIDRKHNVIDALVDGQKSIKAISLSQAPTREGEKVGEIIIKLWEVSKRTMGKLKTFFSKFKGYLLTIALAILTVVEMCGGFINSLFGGVLTINGVEVLPVITLACTAIVGIISNGYSKADNDKIKALFSKSSTNELVKAEIKKTVKTKNEQLTQFNKIQVTKEHELDNLNSELEMLTNTLQAKKQMYQMNPPIATAEDVQLAINAVAECKSKIAEKTAEISAAKNSISNLTTELNALRSQL